MYPIEHKNDNWPTFALCFVKSKDSKVLYSTVTETIRLSAALGPLTTTSSNANNGAGFKPATHLLHPESLPPPKTNSSLSFITFFNTKSKLYYKLQIFT